ncbi:MAG: class I SAM-dependent methyltransferase [Nitrospirae bacterium]|nr:class I SAM-dependent methyltransferase [Nitrospirota bacterium]
MRSIYLALWTNPVTRFIYLACITPLNIIWYYLLHRKFLGDPIQRNLWKDRRSDDFLQVDNVEGDPYYINLDKAVADRLRGFDDSLYLEVGCYYGYRLNKFARELPHACFIGIDLGLENLLFGKKEFITAPNAVVVNADACFLPFRDNSIGVVFTVVCLTHADYSSIGKAIDELTRVCKHNLLLVEVDNRPMSWHRKMAILNWDYGYMHQYEKLVGDKMKLVSMTPLRDTDNHPRYTFFEFSKPVMSP